MIKTICTRVMIMKKTPENVNTEFYIINIFVSKSILEIKAKSQCPDIFIHDIGYTSLLFTCSKGY